MSDGGSGKVVSAVFLLGVTWAGCSRAAAVSCLILGVGVTGLAACGYQVNHLDIAPQYSGVLFGITNTFATLPGFLGPLIVGAITDHNVRTQPT